MPPKYPEYRTGYKGSETELSMMRTVISSLLWNSGQLSKTKILFIFMTQNKSNFSLHFIGLSGLFRSFHTVPSCVAKVDLALDLIQPQPLDVELQACTLIC